MYNLCQEVVTANKKGVGMGWGKSQNMNFALLEMLHHDVLIGSISNILI